MNRKQLKSIFTTEMLDGHNQNLLINFGRCCSIICDSQVFDSRPKLPQKSEIQQELFRRSTKNFSYRLHDTSIISSSSVFTFLSETANEFDWIHNPTGLKLSIKHSKKNSTVCLKNCISNKSVPNNIDYMFITTTGNYKESGGLYIIDYDLAKPTIFSTSNSSKLYYTINYNHIIHYVEIPYVPTSSEVKLSVSKLDNQAQQEIVNLYYDTLEK